MYRWIDRIASCVAIGLMAGFAFWCAAAFVDPTPPEEPRMGEGVRPHWTAVAMAEVEED